MRKTSRRSSILKPPRGSLRAPELDGLPLDDDEGYTQPTSRRVSFSRVSQVQEFDPTIGNLAQWKYQETINIEDGEGINAKSVSVYEENIKMPSLDQKSRRRSAQFRQKDDYGSDLSEFCKDLDVTMSMDNSVMSMNKTTDIYNCSMRNWKGRSIASEMGDMNLSVAEEKKRMFADIESPTKSDPKRMKVKSSSQIQLDRTFGTEMDVTLTCGGIMDDDLKPEISGYGMEMTESVGKILTAKDIKGQKNDSLDLTSPQENVQLDDNDSILSKLNCLGINTPLSTPKEENFSKGHPVFAVKNGSMKKSGNANLTSDLDEKEFTNTRGKFETQSMPSKVSMFEENSMHKENIHPETLMRKGQKINLDLFSGENSIRDTSSLHHKGESIWEGRHKTPKTEKIDHSVQDESVACADGMELTVPLGKLLPSKLEKVVESETSVRETSKNPSFVSSSKHVPNLLGDNSSMYLIRKGRKSISMFEGNRANPDTVQDENAYPGYIEDNNDGDNDVNDISGLEFTVPLGKLIHHNVSEEDEQIIASKKEYVANQSSNNDNKVLTDSVHQICSFPNKNAVNSNDEGPNHLNVNDNELDETFPENDGMELTVPLGKLMELKSHQVNESVNQVEETQKELDSVDFTFSYGNVMQYKPHQINESAKQLQGTQQEMNDMDFTVPHGKLLPLKSFQMNESAKQLQETQQEIDGMDLTVPHGRLMQPKPFQMNESANQRGEMLQETKCVDLTFTQGQSMQCKPHEVNESVKQLEETQQEMDGMELTVPLGKLLELKSHQVNENAKQLEETKQEMNSMDFTVPHGKLLQLKPHQIDESAKQLEQTQQEMDSMDLSGLHGKVEVSNQQMEGMELTVPLGKLLDLEPCDVNRRIPKLEATNPSIEGMKLSVHNEKNLQVEPSAAVTMDTSSVEVEDNNVTRSRGSSFRKSSYSCSEFNFSRRGEESMSNVSTQVNDGDNGQIFSFHKESFCAARELEVSISCKMTETPIHAPPAAIRSSRNGAPQEIAPRENAVENSNRLTMNLKFHSVVEPFAPSNKLQVIVENSAGSEIYDSTIEKEVSCASSSLHNPVCSEPVLSGSDLKSASAINAVEEKTLSMNEKDEINEPVTHGEASRLAQTEKSMTVEESMLVSKVRMEDGSKCSDNSVLDSSNDKRRASKRENPFQYSMPNFKKGAIGSMSSNGLVPEDESVSEPKEIHDKASECLNISEKVVYRKAEEEIRDVRIVVSAEETDGTKIDENQAKPENLGLENLVSLQHVSSQNREEEEADEKRESLLRNKLSPIPFPEEDMADLSAVNEVCTERSENTSEQSNENQAKNLEDVVSQQEVCSQNNEEEDVEKRISLIENEMSPIPKDNSAIIEDPTESSVETSEQVSLLSSTLESKEFDLEKWMKEETSKKWCPWKIHKLEETQWSFYVLYGIVKLTLKLKPISGTLETKSRSVDGMELVSCLDVGNRDFDYLVVNIFLERCAPTILESLCQTTDQLPELFAFMCKEMKSLDGLHKQTTKLYKYYPVIFIDNGFTFSFGSKILMTLFWVEVNLSNWKDGCIEANDVKVINKLGNIREKDIRDILKTVKKDSNYLPRFYEEVKSFIKMLEDLE